MRTEVDVMGDSRAQTAAVKRAVGDRCGYISSEYVQVAQLADEVDRLRGEVRHLRSWGEWAQARLRERALSARDLPPCQHGSRPCPLCDPEARESTDPGGR